MDQRTIDAAAIEAEVDQIRSPRDRRASQALAVCHTEVSKPRGGPELS